MFLYNKEILKIYYYLIVIDGTATSKEIQKFEEIGNRICTSGDFNSKKYEVFTDCDWQMRKSFNNNDYYEVIQAGVKDSLNSIYYLSEEEKKLILWDLLILAECDGTTSEEEKGLIQFISSKWEIDRIVCMEMEIAIKSIGAVEKEIEWAKTINKPYVEIEKLIKELTVRKKTILKSIQVLISD